MYVFPCPYYDYHQTVLTDVVVCGLVRITHHAAFDPWIRGTSERGHVVSGGMRVPYAPSYLTKCFGKDVRNEKYAWKFIDGGALLIPRGCG